MGSDTHFVAKLFLAVSALLGTIASALSIWTFLEERNVEIEFSFKALDLARQNANYLIAGELGLSPWVQGSIILALTLLILYIVADKFELWIEDFFDYAIAISLCLPLYTFWAWLNFPTLSLAELGGALAVFVFGPWLVFFLLDQI